jgi:hypothetical protein
VAHHYGAMQHETGEPGLLRVLSDAIMGGRMVTAQYNGAALKLAPHQVFLRHGALYLGAFNPDKNWRGPDDYRLGNFNFAGLSAVELSETGFAAIPAYDGTPPGEGDQVLVCVSQRAA